MSDTTAEPKAARPSDVTVVTFLALIAAFGDVVAGVNYLISGPDEDVVTYLAWVSLLIGLATAAVAALFFKGSAAAKWIIAILMIARIAFHVVTWISVGSDAAVAAMIEILIASVVLIMVFSRETTAFIAASKK